MGQCIIQIARHRGIHSINIIRDRYDMGAEYYLSSVAFNLVIQQICLNFDNSTEYISVVSVHGFNLE